MAVYSPFSGAKIGNQFPRYCPVTGIPVFDMDTHIIFRSRKKTFRRPPADYHLSKVENGSDNNVLIVLVAVSWYYLA
jgi:hypothetical protein